MATFENPQAAAALVARLSRYDDLSSQEIEVIENLTAVTRQFAKGEDIVVEGMSPLFSTLLLDGFAIRYNLVEDGRRQITAIHVNGDFVDLHCFLLKPMDHSVAALTPCRAALVPHVELRAISERHPHLTRLLWLSTLIDAAMHREWMVGMGRRSILAQLGHLICELYTRLKVVGRVNGLRFDFPVTQSEVSDALGLSLVQTNRTFRALREQHLVTMQGGVVTILDWDRLVEASEFNPLYLHLDKEPR